MVFFLSIKKLVEKGESFDYISQYINVAKKVIDYYEKSLCREKKIRLLKNNKITFLSNLFYILFYSK